MRRWALPWRRCTGAARQLPATPPAMTPSSPSLYFSSNASHSQMGRGRGGEAADSSSESHGRPLHSSYEQFTAQQAQFHRHSFYEKGSAPPGERRSDDSHAGVGSAREAPHSSSSTANQRRGVRQQWERSFFGRLHHEEGMHSRFAEAIAAEKEEETMAAAHQQRPLGSDNDDSKRQMMLKWADTEEEAPRYLFHRLRPSLQLEYIVTRLSQGERRIRYAVDYGSLSMMYQLNLGERMVREAEALLLELGWMNDEVAGQISDIQAVAAKTKYDFDLD